MCMRHSATGRRAFAIDAELRSTGKNPLINNKRRCAGLATRPCYREAQPSDFSLCVCVCFMVPQGMSWELGRGVTRGGCWGSSVMGDLGPVDSYESWAKCDIRILPLASDCT